MLVAVDDCLRMITARFDDTPGRAVVARASDKPASMSFRDRRLREYPSRVVRMRQLVSGPQKLELLYPNGDWFSAFVEADVAVHEDSVPQQPPDVVGRVGVADTARSAPPERVVEGERTLPMYGNRLQTPLERPQSVSRNARDFINVCRVSTRRRRGDRPGPRPRDPANHLAFAFVTPPA
jgi:hypothetical protein